MKSGRGGQADTHHAPVQGREKGTPIRRPGRSRSSRRDRNPLRPVLDSWQRVQIQEMVARWLIGVIALLAVVAVIFLAVSAMLDGGGG